MRCFRYWLVLTVLGGPIAGCGSNEGEVQRTKQGNLVPVPVRPGLSQEEQKAKYLKLSKEQGRPRG